MNREHLSQLFLFILTLSTQSLWVSSFGISRHTMCSPAQLSTSCRVFSTVSPYEISKTVASSSSGIGLVVGDTKGAALLLEDVAISRGSNQILRDIYWRVERKERWGLVGPNGAGKSTLLGAIIGSARMDSGIAMVAPKLQVGYLKQTAVSGSNRTVFEEAASEMYAINEAKRKMEFAESAVIHGDTSDTMMALLDDATTEFTAAGGWTQEQEVDSVLKGLGFRPEDSKRLCSEFSGGWQMRIALARLLLSKPSLLLLDEPSNHLDSSARDWLGKYLAASDGSIVLVSHDVPLLQASVNNIAEVAGGTLITYVSCSYNKYLDEKEFRAKSATAEYERNMAEAAKLQSFVDRFGASATKASSAQSRVKMIEKMKKEGKLTPPPLAVVEKKWKPSLVLPTPPKSMGDTLLSLRDASIGYGTEGDALLKGIDLDITRGMKILFRGKNGAGKSTLMAALRGTLSPLSGARIENENLRLGVFTQDLAQELDIKARAIDLVTAYARTGKYGDITISDEAARSVMGRLGLTGDKSLRKVGELSGGEKARVALSMFALKASNILLLDEPSNHLDIECIEALSEALSSWGGKDGAVIVVSHDRSFCDTIGFTHIGTVKNGSLTVEERGLRDSDWDIYDLEACDHVKVGNGVTDSHISSSINCSKEDSEEMKRKRKLAFNAPKRIAKLEEMVANTESEISLIDEEMFKVGSDVGLLLEMTQKREKLRTKVTELMSEWEDLELLLTEVNSFV